MRPETKNLINKIVSRTILLIIISAVIFAVAITALNYQPAPTKAKIDLTQLWNAEHGNVTRITLFTTYEGLLEKHYEPELSEHAYNVNVTFLIQRSWIDGGETSNVTLTMDLYNGDAFVVTDKVFMDNLIMGQYKGEKD